MHLERRRHPRSRVDVQVRLQRTEPLLAQSFTTGIVNLNYYGACLLIPSALALNPTDKLKLVIVLRMNEGRIIKLHHRNVRVKWTNGNRAGVEFLGLD